MSLHLPYDTLAALDAQIENALRTGDVTELTVLGYGEISCIVLARSGAGEFACKRLPLFTNDERLDQYRQCFRLYQERLVASGVEPVASELVAIPRPDGSSSAYCVQPALPSPCILPKYLATCSPQAAVLVFSRLLDAILSCVQDDLGLDGQLSNWVLLHDKLLYLDICTPLIRDDRGRELLDTELFLQTIPVSLRRLVRCFLIATILDKYYLPRGVVLDLLGNCYKERLGHLLPEFLRLANTRLGLPIRPTEVEAYYRRDARMWALLQRLRRLDRFWQQKILHRPYPYLLPGKIARKM